MTPTTAYTGNLKRNISGSYVAPCQSLSTDKPSAHIARAGWRSCPGALENSRKYWMLINSTKTEGEGEKKNNKNLLFLVKWIRQKQGYSPHKSHPFPSAVIPQNRWAVPPWGQDKFSYPWPQVGHTTQSYKKSKKKVLCPSKSIFNHRKKIKKKKKGKYELRAFGSQPVPVLVKLCLQRRCTDI